MMIRVLVVDDSALMRRIISRMLGKDQFIQVVGTAENGEEAIEKIEALKPDVVTMDVEMPRMNGLEALKHIMSRTPLPVIMLSAVTKEGAGITLDALNLGACDFVPKDLAGGVLNISRIEGELIRKVKAVAKRRMGSFLLRQGSGKQPLAFVAAGRTQRAIVAMGASTGGPPALQHILTSLPKDFPVPIAIAQHMPKTFTQSFAERLNAMTQIVVKEAENKERLTAGVALLAPGDMHMSVRRRGPDVIVELVEDQNYVYRPSVDLLLSGIANIYESKTIAVILTGMGTDGLNGVRDVRARNGYVIAQDEETSAVYGMPKAVAEAQLANAVVPLQKVVEEIIRVL
jgi:two-component system, chemotaxis family, protein-glutamate methylesterase/glutaminase